MIARPLLLALWLAVAVAPAAAQSSAAESRDMRLVGASDLQARSAYQPTIHRQGSRWIAYIGHHGGTDEIPMPVNPMTGKAEPNGTSIVDVTDPRQPKYLAHIPGLEGLAEQGGGQMVRACDGKSLPKGDPSKTYLNAAHAILSELRKRAGIGTVLGPLKPRTH